MTGPEHYKMAEENIIRAGGTEYGGAEERFWLAQAQVHATLAVAAATALQPGADIPVYDDPTLRSWQEVAS